MRTPIRALTLGLAVLVVAGVAVAVPRAPDPAETAPTLAPAYAPPAELRTTQVVGRNETLSQALLRADLPASELHLLSLALTEQTDPRRIRPNTPVVVRRWAEDGAPRAVEVALDADRTVLLERSSVGWRSHTMITPTRIDTLAFAGRLGPGGSLWADVMSHRAIRHLSDQDRRNMVVALASDVYGWQVNFFSDVRPGDSYRVAYEREVRPDGSTRRARILVAEMVNRGDTIPAIHFDPRGDGGGYFDTDGESLQLAFNRYPVDVVRITSNFSWQRYHPILRRGRPHLGTDFGTGRGAPIKATADGVVRHAGWDGGYGIMVRIDHGNGYETRYAHLSRVAPRVRPGARVRQGQRIGDSGDTGLATAPHLHYELRRHGAAQNPRTVRLPANPPVPDEHMAAFEVVVAERQRLLPPPAAPLPETLAAN